MFFLFVSMLYAWGNKCFHSFILAPSCHHGMICPNGQQLGDTPYGGSSLSKAFFMCSITLGIFFYKFPWISLSTNLTYWRLSVPVIIYPLGLSSLSLSQHQMRKFSMTARREADEFYLSVRRMASVWGRASSEVYDRQSHFLEVWGRKPPKVEYVYWYLFCLHFCT